MKERCERALEIVWSARHAEGPDTPEVAEARRHLVACPPCRAYLRRDEVLAARLREIRLSTATPCPENVRARVAREMANEDAVAAAIEGSAAAVRAASESDSRDGLVDTLKDSLIDRLQGRRRLWPPWVEGAVAATAAAILIGGGLVLSDRLQAGLPNEAFVEDFRRTALPEIVRQPVSRDDVRAFHRAHFDTDGPAFMLDMPVTKVALCKLDGRMGTMVEYDWSGERLVFYQVPREGEERNGSMRAAREGDLNMARWADERYDYALVSSMPDEELMELAKQARTART